MGCIGLRPLQRTLGESRSMLSASLRMRSVPNRRLILDSRAYTWVEIAKPISARIAQAAGNTAHGLDQHAFEFAVLSVPIAPAA